MASAIKGNLDTIPYNCLVKISTFLDTTDKVRLASCSKIRLEGFPGTLVDGNRELAFRFFLEDRLSAERALLRAINTDKFDVVAELFLRNPNISAAIGVRALERINQKGGQERTVHYNILKRLPQYRLLTRVPFLDHVRLVDLVVVPLLRLSIGSDWLGQTLMHTATNTGMNSGVKGRVISLLLEKKEIPAPYVKGAFLGVGKLNSHSDNEKILLVFLAKRPDSIAYFKKVGIETALSLRYFKLLSALIAA